MIGIAPGEHRRASSVSIPPGMLLCFYTDGVIERSSRPIDDSLARLCEVVTAQPPEAACAAVMAALVGRDDIALLMVHRQPARHPAGATHHKAGALPRPAGQAGQLIRTSTPRSVPTSRRGRRPARADIFSLLSEASRPAT
jgi:Stage II sporulation protein E (SpoIIE)